MNLPKCLSIVLALPLTVATLSAGQEGRSNANQTHADPLTCAKAVRFPLTPAEYRQLLGVLKTDLDRLRSLLAEIDVGSLGVDYNRGKMIDSALSRAKRAIDDCREFESRLEKRQTLGDNVRLDSCMDLVAFNISDAHDTLNWMGGDSAKVRRWASELRVHLTVIGKDGSKLTRHVLALADIADESCPELRRDLH